MSQWRNLRPDTGATGSFGGRLFPELDGTSPALCKLKQHMACVSRDPDVTVLIVGESGTGKERIARAIHSASPRSRSPFVVVDCAALSATLAEDTLYGHVRGAFTGAIDEHAGPFERANGGTVLLDEVGDLPLDLQMKLLRAIQSRTVLRLGARQETAFDVRIIASTNVDLTSARQRGCFRDDLYYRLNVYQIKVPSLRHRGAADIRALAVAILMRLTEGRRRNCPRLDETVVDVLVRYKWPGNVRELENTLERMLVAAGTEPVLTTRHLPEDFGWQEPLVEGAARRSLPDASTILAALQRNGSRAGRAAADLGLSRHQLYRLLKRHGIEISNARG